MTNPDLVERDDPNGSKHKEADSSEILNVVDIDPVPQYASDNANFDLNFSTYKYREAQKLGSGIWMNKRKTIKGECIIQY